MGVPSRLAVGLPPIGRRRPSRRRPTSASPPTSSGRWPSEPSRPRARLR